MNNLRGQLLQQAPLAEYTTWRVGGLAKTLYKPADGEDLSHFLQQLPKDEPILWLGLGSNCLIRDGGFKGTVIVTQNCLNGLTLLEAHRVFVEAGVSCAKMARFCARNELSAAEFWAGIPGTMGGALRMNAGCYNGETWNFVDEVVTINRQGSMKTRLSSEFTIGYRSVQGLEQDEWFLSAICRLPPGNKENSLQVIRDLLERRALTQPTNEYNCGSVFRNPTNDYAARLIESCGLKGKKIGHAKVSEKHANFIINEEGRALARHIEELIHLVKQTVFEKTAIELIQEVHIIGDLDE